MTDSEWEMTEENFLKNIEPQIMKLMESMKIPSISIGFIKKGNILLKKSYGYANLEKQRIANSSSIYGIGSVAKSFTALLLMKLEESGILHIDDPIDKYLPLHFEDREISLRHLLSHGSGIPSTGIAPIIAKKLKYTKMMDLIPDIDIEIESMEDLIDHIEYADEFIHYQLGEKFYYFNAGYTLLSFAIEKATGMSYEEALSKYVLIPLGMSSSSCLVEKLEETKIVTPYDLTPSEDGVNVTPAKHLLHPLVHAGGGLLSSLDDMLIYVKAMLESDFVSYDIKREMFHIHTQTDDQTDKTVFGSDSNRGYGYGWGINENFNGYVQVAHGGSTGTSAAYISLFPDLKTGFVLLTNQGTPGTQPFIYALNSYLLGISSNPPWFQKQKLFTKLEGEYQFMRGIPLSAKVENRGGVLYLKTTLAQTDQPLFPVNNSFSAYGTLKENDGIITVNFYLESPFGRLPIFFTLKGDKLLLHVERSVFKKIKAPQSNNNDS